MPRWPSTAIPRISCEAGRKGSLCICNFLTSQIRTSLKISRPRKAIDNPSMNCITFPFRLQYSAPVEFDTPTSSLASLPSRNPVNFSVFALHAQIRNSPLIEGQEASKAISSADDLCTLPSFSVYVRAAENSGRHASETMGAE